MYNLNKPGSHLHTHVSMYNLNKPWGCLHTLWREYHLKNYTLAPKINVRNGFSVRNSSSFFIGRHWKGSSLWPLVQASQPLVLTALFFSWFSWKAGLVRLTCLTAQPSPWARLWAVPLTLQVLSVWINSTSQAFYLFVSSLLCFLEFPSAKCCGAAQDFLPFFMCAFPGSLYPQGLAIFSDSAT